MDGRATSESICEAQYKRGEPDASQLSRQLYDECYKGTAHKVEVPRINTDNPLKLYQTSMDGNDPATSAYMKVRDSVPKITASDGAHKPEYGSGFYVSSDGLLVSNHHVIAQGRDKITVTDSNNEVFEATKILEDQANDLVLLRVKPNKAGQTFPAVDIGSSTALKQGQDVLVMGHTLGMDPVFLEVTKLDGPVIERNIQHLKRERLIQQGINSNPDRELFEVNGQVAPGNSGGPSLDQAGTAVGINDFSNPASGKAYVIPIERATELVDKAEQLKLL